MSGYDVAVWHSTVAMTSAQARSFYDHLDNTVMFARDPQTDAFVVDLRRLYPDLPPGAEPPSCSNTPDYYLQSRDDPAPKPQPLTAESRARIEAAGETVWNGDIDCHGPVVTMSVVWDQALTVVGAVQKLAAKHGLTFYETEGATVINPPGLPPTPHPPLARIRVTLRIAGKQPLLDTTVLFNQFPVAHATLPSRQEAHDLARRIAAEKGDLGYKVDDPRATAQAFTWVPVQGFPNTARMGVFRLVPRDGNPDTPDRGGASVANHPP